MKLVEYNLEKFKIKIERRKYMLGDKIINERKKHKLSQEELAEMIGVTRQTISNWELNETSPDLKQAQKLSNIFDISLDELIGRKNLLLEKIDKTECNSKLLIKLVKVVGITLGTLIFILLCVICLYIYSTKYYTSELTSSGEGSTCYYNGKVKNYIVMKNNNDGTLSFDIDEVDIINEFNLHNVKSVEPKELLDKIVAYIENNGGTCLKDN